MGNFSFSHAEGGGAQTVSSALKGRCDDSRSDGCR